jgi:hypothetical protein
MRPMCRIRQDGGEEVLDRAAKSLVCSAQTSKCALMLLGKARIACDVQMDVGRRPATDLLEL